MCRSWSTDKVLVNIPKDLSHTGRARWDEKYIDSCIADIVRVLNEGGIYTRTSCCGHGNGDGEIILQDGRIINILGVG